MARREAGVTMNAEAPRSGALRHDAGRPAGAEGMKRPWKGAHPIPVSNVTPTGKKKAVDSPPSAFVSGTSARSVAQSTVEGQGESMGPCLGKRTGRVDHRRVYQLAATVDVTSRRGLGGAHSPFSCQ